MVNIDYYLASGFRTQMMYQFRLSVLENTVNYEVEGKCLRLIN